VGFRTQVLARHPVPTPRFRLARGRRAAIEAELAPDRARVERELVTATRTRLQGL
jgi:hypothetical protein